MYACGFCGCPCDKDGNQLEIPENYNPNDYELSVCNDCHAKEEEKSYVIITREMALDAGDPSLEGQRWPWK